MRRGAVTPERDDRRSSSDSRGRRRRRRRPPARTSARPAARRDVRGGSDRRLRDDRADAPARRAVHDRLDAPARSRRRRARAGWPVGPRSTAWPRSGEPSRRSAPVTTGGDLGDRSDRRARRGRVPRLDARPAPTADRRSRPPHRDRVDPPAVSAEPDRLERRCSPATGPSRSAVSPPAGRPGPRRRWWPGGAGA